jgi:hypothetical protein
VPSVPNSGSGIRDKQSLLTSASGFYFFASWGARASGVQDAASRRIPVAASPDILTFMWRRGSL